MLALNNSQCHIVKADPCLRASLELWLNVEVVMALSTSDGSGVALHALVLSWLFERQGELSANHLDHIIVRRNDEVRVIR